MHGYGVRLDLDHLYKQKIISPIRPSMCLNLDVSYTKVICPTGTSKDLQLISVINVKMSLVKLIFHFNSICSFLQIFHPFPLRNGAGFLKFWLSDLLMKLTIKFSLKIFLGFREPGVLWRMRLEFLQADSESSEVQFFKTTPML